MACNLEASKTPVRAITSDGVQMVSYHIMYNGYGIRIVHGL